MATKFRMYYIKQIIPDPPAPTFPSVQIGNQIWMSENLQINDGGEGIRTVQSVIAEGHEFGPQTYYTYDAAVRVANTIDGWHLPTLSEWEELSTYFDGDASNAKSTIGWGVDGNGTNTLGLNIQPLGRFEDQDLTSLGAVGEEANLWCAHSYPASIFFYSNWYGNWGTYWDGHGNTVRLIKD